MAQTLNPTPWRAVGGLNPKRGIPEVSLQQCLQGLGFREHREEGYPKRIVRLFLLNAVLNKPVLRW